MDFLSRLILSSLNFTVCRSIPETSIIDATNNQKGQPECIQKPYPGALAGRYCEFHAKEALAITGWTAKEKGERFRPMSKE